MRVNFLYAMFRNGQFLKRFAGKDIRPARTVPQGRARDAAAAVWPGMDGVRRRPVLSENLYDEEETASDPV